MEQLSVILERLSERHRSALEWFLTHAGTEQPWPEPLDEGTTHLASKAKGIYKPKWSTYALSVRQTLGSPYPDLDPVTRLDGTWAYSYFQEKTDPQARNSEFTNQGLMDCMRDSIPVGVMRQVSDRSPVRYFVHGLALVAGWDDGYFFLEGFAPSGYSHGRGPRAALDILALEQERDNTLKQAIDPTSILESRKRTLAAITLRRGQPEFRQKLPEAYGARCAITGCEAIQALEAAHIIPYHRDPRTNHPSNGLLLRADVHTLFDLGLIAVDTVSMTVLVAPSISASYGGLAGSLLQIPNSVDYRPNKVSLDYHRNWANL